MVSSPPVYEQLLEALQGLDVEVSAPEAHGSLCGLLCARGPDVEARWISTILASKDERTVMSRASLEALHDVYRASESELCEELFGFQLLLPSDDEAEVAERVAALGQWCHGFMLGLAEGGIGDLNALPDEVPEVLEDLSEIARVAGYETEEDEQNEAAYAELVEYVRVAVTLAYQTLQGPSQPIAGSDQPTH
jgi:uncharacterized protein YgfB (UPF0149 family)